MRFKPPDDFGVRGAVRGVGDHGGGDHGGGGTAGRAPWSRARAPEEPSDVTLLPFLPQSSSSLTPGKLLHPKPGQIQRETGKGRTGRAASAWPRRRNAAGMRDAKHLGMFSPAQHRSQRRAEPTAVVFSPFRTPGMPFIPSSLHPAKGLSAVKPRGSRQRCRSGARLSHHILSRRKKNPGIARLTS